MPDKYMRIIGGEYKSRLIDMPKGIRIRPTQDKVREAVFNILVNVVEGADVLDLYAGSGAFGLEALSRGANRVVFLDINQKCIEAIGDNIARLAVKDERTLVLRLDAGKALKVLNASGEKFDLVFLDPPYHKGLAKNCLRLIMLYDILAFNNFIIIEHYKTEDLGEIGGVFRTLKRTYGDTAISIFKKKM